MAKKPKKITHKTCATEGCDTELNQHDKQVYSVICLSPIMSLNLKETIHVVIVGYCPPVPIMILRLGYVDPHCPSFLGRLGRGPPPSLWPQWSTLMPQMSPESQGGLGQGLLPGLPQP